VTYPTARIDADQSPVSAYSVRGAYRQPLHNAQKSEPDRPMVPFIYRCPNTGLPDVLRKWKKDAEERTLLCVERH
jgi:hypothetical protein